MKGAQAVKRGPVIINSPLPYAGITQTGSKVNLSRTETVQHPQRSIFFCSGTLYHQKNPMTIAFFD